MENMRWLKWENGTEWGEIECPMLDGEMVMTYYLKGRPCYDTYTAPFVEDGQIYYYEYDHDGDYWREGMNWLGEYDENTKCSFGM